jgi:hypothetical protein
MKTQASVCVLTFGLLACVNHAAAGSDGEFQSEVGFGYAKFDFGDGIDGDTKAWILTRHFLPVSTDDHPLAEAAFLERASSVTLYLDRSDTKVDMFTAATQTVALDISLAQESSRYVVDLAIAMTSGGVGGTDVSIRQGLAGLGLGWYATPNLRVGATVATMDELVSVSRDSVDDYANSYGFNGKWVQPVSDTNAIGVEAAYVRERLGGDSGKSKGYAIDMVARYYLTRFVGAGVLLEKTSNNKAGDTKTFGANLRAFFTEQYSLELEFAKTTDDDDGEVTQVSAIIGARF